jgi:hypothetical protein
MEYRGKRKGLCFVFLLLFTFSCSSMQLRPDRTLAADDDSPYCELLHVPHGKAALLPDKPYLGIYLAHTNSGRKVPGCTEELFIQAAGVITGSPAEDAGIEEGDIIFSFDNIPTCGPHDTILDSFKKLIEEKEIGSAAIMEVLRGGQKLTLGAILGRMPVHNRPEAVHKSFEKCRTPSVLEKKLRTETVIRTYERVISGLHHRTNVVQNPGTPAEEDSARLQLRETAFIMRHPLAAGIAANEITGKLVSSVDKSDWSLADMLEKTAGLLDIETAGCGKPDEITFPNLLRVMEDTKNRVEEALANLEPGERLFLQEKALNPRLDEEWNSMLEISMKFNRSNFFNAFSPLLSLLTGDNLRLLKEDIIKRFGDSEAQVLYEAMTPFGRVIVGGYGPNVYHSDAALILDPGGDDLYLNNAGGTRTGMPVALVIDWEGDDRYITKENFSQGAGLLGGGFLLDLSGNDTFVSVDAGQGAGFFGLGFLYHGYGKSIFTSRSFSQGAGQMGIGLLLNLGSDDLYFSSHHGQGLGHFGGAGVLIDLDGDDRYSLGGSEPDFRDPSRATVSLGQGFGIGIRPEKGIHAVPGGIGILIDQSGNDLYLADYFAQGASYYHGLGILSDMKGDDTYIAGRYAQGAGIHSSAGVLIDHAGNDFYYSSFGVSQGVGHDYGVGFLHDRDGDDHYRGGTVVQGAATNGSLGLFIDINGTNTYQHNNMGQGFSDKTDGLGIMIKAESEDKSAAGADEKILIRLGTKIPE